MRRPALALLALLALAIPAALRAQNADTPAVTPSAAATDPAYLLTPGDTVMVNVYGEPDMSASQLLDSNGRLRLPLVGEIELGTLSVREAEDKLERLYVSRELLRAPLVSISVVSYATREVSVLGAVRAPGNFQFPKEATSLDIVDLIARIGGFLPTAKSDAVSVIHRNPNGAEESTVIDVEKMITGRQRADSSRRQFAVYPGDRIWVPSRLF